MTWLLVKSFLLATAISFAGSVQLGPVNFGTIHTALNKNKTSAILFGFGGSLPELIYSALALGGASYVLQFDQLQQYLKYLTSGILLVFGLILIFQKSKEANKVYQIKEGNYLWAGMLFGLFNPQLFPFWLFIISYLNSNEILVSQSFADQVAFCLGTMAGAFLLQWLVAEFTSRKREFIYLKLTKNYNKVLGAVILLVAIIQFVINF